MEFQGKKCQGESERERLTRKNLERKSKNKRDSKLFYSFVDIALLLLFQRGLLRELMFWSFKKKRPLALLPIHSCLAFVHWIGFPTVIWRAKRWIQHWQLKHFFKKKWTAKESGTTDHMQIPCAAITRARKSNFAGMCSLE